jgi:voltage-gated potassium channel Kch
MRQRVSAYIGAYRRHRFGWLFATLLATLALGPFVSPLIGFNPLQLLLAVNLVAAIAGAAQHRSIRVLVWLGAAYLVARGLGALFDVRALLPVSDAVWLVAAIVAMAATARRAMRADAVDSEHIFAALDAYLLVGLIFGVGYSMLDQVWPDSFGSTSASDLGVARGIYFSFVTLATLGYGDVVPLSDAARGLAMLEAVTGQMYMAVLVARLVSAYRR